MKNMGALLSEINNSNECLLNEPSVPLLQGISAGVVSLLVEKLVGPRTLSTKVPEILQGFALNIPAAIREKTSFIGAENVAAALKHINETHTAGVSEIILTDVDGTLADIGGIKRRDTELAQLSSSGYDVLGMTNRHLWFPLTTKIKKWVEGAGIPLYLDADQQNPYNRHENQQTVSLISDLATRIKGFEGKVRISTLFDVLNPVPPTWNDLGILGISNAVFPQYLTKKLAEQGAFAQGQLPLIDLYGINPAIKQYVTITAQGI